MKWWPTLNLARCSTASPCRDVSFRRPSTRKRKSVVTLRTRSKNSVSASSTSRIASKSRTKLCPTSTLRSQAPLSNTMPSSPAPRSSSVNSSRPVTSSTETRSRPLEMARPLPNGLPTSQLSLASSHSRWTKTTLRKSTDQATCSCQRRSLSLSVPGSL